RARGCGNARGPAPSRRRLPGRMAGGAWSSRRTGPVQGRLPRARGARGPGMNPGPLPIHWYGVMYAVAFLAAYQFGVLPYAIKRGLPKAVAEKITVWTIIFGLLGGRLYYVVQQPDLWQNYVLHPINIIAFWQGGMAFFGAIIVGFATLAICAWRYGYNPW